jgi:ectoine hydroxylase-related dioxygenase (phytanoyl-CoA dioxygenase family)
MQDDQTYNHRMSERHQEYRQRRLELQLAAEGIEPVGIDPKSPSYGGQAFVESLQGVDIDAVLDTVATVHRQGYAVVPFLPEETLTEVREAMAPLFSSSQRLFGNVDTTLEHNQTVHVQNVLAKTNSVDRVASNAMLRAIIAGILGHDFILNAGAVAMAPDPGCSPQGLHRDDGFFALIPRPHLPLVVTVAIALDDFTRENGGTQIVPDSCCWPAERRPQPDELECCEMPAGSMLIWDGALFHGGGGNSTADQPRRTLTLNYTRGWLRTQFNQYLSIPRQRILAMPPELQADLGYHRSAMGLGGCDMRDPLQYLQRLVDAGGDGLQFQLGREYEG